MEAWLPGSHCCKQCTRTLGTVCFRVQAVLSAVECEKDCVWDPVCCNLPAVGSRSSLQTPLSPTTCPRCSPSYCRAWLRRCELPPSPAIRPPSSPSHCQAWPQRCESACGASGRHFHIHSQLLRGYSLPAQMDAGKDEGSSARCWDVTAPTTHCTAPCLALLCSFLCGSWCEVSTERQGLSFSFGALLQTDQRALHREADGVRAGATPCCRAPSCGRNLQGPAGRRCHCPCIPGEISGVQRYR